MKKRFGFTLAEVLITLGIIGVVAAMTIPTLIQNTNSTKWASQYKKDLATLTNAIEMAQAHNDIDISVLTQPCVAGPAAGTITFDTGAVENRNSICSLINTTLSGVQYVSTLQGFYTDGTQRYNIINGTGAALEDTLVYRLADGSVIGVNRTLGRANNTCAVQPGQDPGAVLGAECKGFIDVNGVNPPNRVIQCNGAASPNTTSRATCATVRNNGDVFDVFPIVLYNGTAAPSSAAAATLLSQTK